MPHSRGMPLVAGIDSSTQSCKVSIRDADSGAEVRSGVAGHPPGTEVDPEAWWEALLQAAAAAGGLDDVAAVSVAGQQHGMVALDADGQVVRPALLWNDTRSAAAAEQLIAEVGADEYALRTGIVPVASFTCSKLRWLRDAEPDNAARVQAVALPHDWLSWRLRGYGQSRSPGPALEQLTTDRSDASGTGYFDPTGNQYDRELLTLALGHDAVLPRVLGPAEPAGEIPGGAAMAPGAGDNAGAALGLRLEPADTVVSIGTSGTVFAPTGTAVHDPTGTIAGFADASGGYLPLTAALNASRVIDTVAAMLGVGRDALAQLASQARPGADGVVLIPHFEGERTPNLPSARASWHGLSMANSTPANLARAGYEGMLANLAIGVEAVRAAGAATERIVLIGGSARSAMTHQVAAQVFGVDIVVPQPGEYVARGAAYQAAWTVLANPPQWPAPPASRLPAAPEPAIYQQFRRYLQQAVTGTDG